MVEIGGIRCIKTIRQFPYIPSTQGDSSVGCSVGGIEDLTETKITKKINK